MNPKLMDAVAVFKELGWATAAPEAVMQLPLGTPEQRRAALAGLKSGEWGKVAEIAKRTYGYRSHVDADEGMLGLFAVRIGVDARRAATVLRAENSALLAAVIAARGEKYAADFIGCACVSRRRMYEHSASVFGNTAVRLVDALNLDIPQSVEYIKDWAVYAAHAMGIPSEIRYRETGLPGPDMIRRRYAEHIHAGVAVGAPATGPFGRVLPAGVTLGWLGKEQAVQLAFAALDAAVRPGDRKVWLDVLEELGVSGEAFCARAQALIPLLSAGDPAVVRRLAPVLIARVGDDLLTEVLIAAFSAAGKKTRQTVLKAALQRTRPEGADALAPWLAMLAGDGDRAVAAAAQRLMTHWAVSAEALPEEEAGIRGFWNHTPPVWQVPAFTLGDVCPEALTELAAEVVRRPAVVHDTATERLLAVANAVARENPEAARTSLWGLRPGGERLIDLLLYWVKRETPRYGFDDEKTVQPLLCARDYVACLHLGGLPCLLSTPSLDDLSVALPDLAARLWRYGQAGVNAQEADLLLALTRLNPATRTADTAKALRALEVAIELQSGRILPISAGQLVLRYLDDPIAEPGFTVNQYGHWARQPIRMPGALEHFPNRFTRYSEERFSTFPLWGDWSLDSVRWDSEVYHEKGLVLRQVARRANPLPRGAAVNLLAAQRSHTPDAAEDALLAVSEAWRRGLLRPGAADVGWLDWSAAPPSNLVALAAALDGFVRDGMLAVVWPVLDALIAASLKAPRMSPGTAEIAALMLEFLPEAEAAIQQGKADERALELPGIRALAGRGGASRAVTVARQLAALLPPVQSTPPKEISAVMEPPFGDVWPAGNEARPHIEDGAVVTVGWADPGAKTKIFCFTLTLPGIADKVFQVVKPGWYYDLEREGQCEAYPVSAGVTTFAGKRGNRVWLHWGAQQQSMAVCERRNWKDGDDGPLKGVKRPPLPQSLLTVVVGLLAQDGDAVYFAPRLLRELIEEGQIGAALIQKAARTLLRSPVVSPAKLVRSLEKDVRLLPVLWPMLTESVKAAGAAVAAGGAPPVWVNRVLDVALRYGLYLKEAAGRGLIPQESAGWGGLRDIACAKAKSTAVKKAGRLLAILQGTMGIVN